MELYGRHHELATARQAVEALDAGRGSLLLLSGEAGIGKSRLAEGIADMATKRGAAVAWGRVWEAGGAPALWPWTQVFRSLGLDDAVTALPDGDDKHERFRMLDLAATRLEKHAATRPLLVVLDDLHVADVPSLLLLWMLAQRVRHAPMLLVGAHRPPEARTGDEATQLLAKIAREGQTLPLARLDRRALGEWLESAAPVTDLSLDELLRVSEGNPLFVQEALILARSGHHGRFDEGLGAVLDEHLGQLDDATREVLSHAAVLGRDGSLATVAALGERTPDEVHHAARKAIEAGVLESCEADTLRFSHVLFRDRLYHALAPSQRSALHWRTGMLMKDEPDRRQAAALHLLEGLDHGELDIALAIARDAALRALGRLAFEDAAELAQHAAGKADDPSGERTLELRLVEAEARMSAGDTARGEPLCAAIAEAAQRAERWPQQARAALIYASELGSGTVDVTMIDMLQRAHDRAPDAGHPLAIRVMARLAAAKVPPRKPEDLDQALELAARARHAAEALGDEDTLLYVLRYGVRGVGFALPASERRANALRCYQLALALGRRAAQVELFGSYFAAVLEEGRRHDADAALQRYAAVLEDYPQGHYRWRLPAFRALLALFDGNADEAFALNEEAMEVATSGAIGKAMVACVAQRWSFACALQQPERVTKDKETLGSIHDVANQIEPLRVERIWRAAATGRGEEARSPLKAHEERQALFWAGGGVGLFGPTAMLLAEMARLMGKRDAAIAHYRTAAMLVERIGVQPLTERIARGLDELESAEPTSARGIPAAGAVQAGAAPPTLEREGDVWALRSGDQVLRLKHSKGLLYLDYLLRNPGREVHVLELIGSEHGDSDAGEVLDPQARAAYSARLAALREALDEAEQRADLGAAEKARGEIDALAQQLAEAVGLGGRARRSGSHAERARINVQRRLKAALDRIRDSDPPLARYLHATLSTGVFCSFEPL
jgi:tetratricopeptide (TPR) repeat protein